MMRVCHATVHKSQPVVNCCGIYTCVQLLEDYLPNFLHCALIFFFYITVSGSGRSFVNQPQTFSSEEVLTAGVFQTSLKPSALSKF